MILQFPNLACLKTALISRAIPERIAANPISVRFEENGAVVVESADTLTSSQRARLKSLHVQGRRAAGFRPQKALSCWAEILPLQRSPDAPQPVQGSVLFEIEPAEGWESISRELLRLGNTRQSLRLVTTKARTQNRQEQPIPTEVTETPAPGSRAYLLVQSPSLYTLLRCETVASDAQVTAYSERQPGVWIPWGYQHPLSLQLKPDSKRWLLVPINGPWKSVAVREMQEFEDLIEVNADCEPHEVELITQATRLKVELKLVPLADEHPAEAWIIDAPQWDSLEDFVASAASELLHGLAFAVGESDSTRRMFLVRRPGHTVTPSFVFEHQAFRRDQRIANLLLPTDRQLVPAVSPETISQLLAPDPARLSWLTCTDADRFECLTIADEGLRPLTEFVEYVIESSRADLLDWLNGSVFDLEWESDESTKNPSDEPSEIDSGDRELKTRPANQRPLGSTSTDDPNPAPGQQARKADATGRSAARKPSSGSSERSKSAQKTLRRKRRSPSTKTSDAAPPELSSLEGAGSERAEVWRQYGTRLADTPQPLSCHLAWLHAVWESPAAQRPRQLQEWSDRSPAAADTDTVRTTLLIQLRESLREPAGSKTRSVTDSLIDSLRPFLIEHESRLPIHASWLGWKHLADLKAVDLLQLAQARDRLITRLDQLGLSPLSDYPPLVAESSNIASSTSRRERLNELIASICSWSRSLRKDRRTDVTDELIRCLYADGLRRLGDSELAAEVFTAARKQLDESDPLQNWIAAAFESRLRHGDVLDELPDRLQEALDQLDRMTRYKLDRLRQQIPALAGRLPIDPFRPYRRTDHSRAPKTTRDTSQQLAGIRRWLEHPQDQDAAQSRIQAGRLLEMADQWPQLSTIDRREFVRLARPGLQQLTDPAQRRELLSALLEQSADRSLGEQLEELPEMLVQVFSELESLDTESATGWLQVGQMGIRYLRSIAAWQSLQALNDEFDRIAALLGPAAGDASRLTEPLDAIQIVGLQFELLSAAMRPVETSDDSLILLLDRHEARLRTQPAPAAIRTKLAQLYIQALGQLPVTAAWPRLKRLFEPGQLEIRDSFSTSAEYSLSHLVLAQAAVSVLTSERFGLSQRWMEWLDREEDRLRQRIQSEFATAAGEYSS